jgi:hypothetical protein
VRERSRWEDNIKIDYESVDSLQLDQDRNKWRAFVNVLMNIRIT